MVLTSTQPLQRLEVSTAASWCGWKAASRWSCRAPDREVRLAVVKRMLADTPARDDAALADYLAARPADSVRGVQGVVSSGYR